MLHAHYTLAFLCLHVFASPITEQMIVHERVARVPPDFLDLSPPADSTILNLRINLVSSDRAGLEATLKEISAPSSPTYGNWLSKEQVVAYARPSTTTHALVADWLAQHGIINSKNISAAGNWIAFPIALGTANQMLDANFSTYRYIRTLAYSIPATLRNTHIRLIHPTISYVYYLYDITPACLLTLYNIPPSPANRNSASQLAVPGFNDEFASAEDLSTFLKGLRPDIPSSTSFSILTLDGGRNEQYYPGVEAAVDLQYTVSLTGAPVTFITVGQNIGDSMDGFLDLANALLEEDDPPQVITTSYDFSSEDAVPESLAHSLCDAYMKLSARGVSLLFSSGDGGVAATQGNGCRNFVSAFPSCPYVTLVGGTQNIPEEAAPFSAGESAAVNKYLEQLGSQYTGRFNRSGRGYPDVSAQGYKLEIIHEGQAKLVEGTSCSSPIFAAIIALLNEERLNAGKPVMGFLNPWLYANPGAFNDIVSGNNPGCGTQGFSATNGWDPVTGLGTPDYPRMRAAAGLA
ncbi:family S53 protease [Mycena latifolia]|nr:family S53 protease [Mycena latifolia]